MFFMVIADLSIISFLIPFDNLVLDIFLYFRYFIVIVGVLSDFLFKRLRR